MSCTYNDIERPNDLPLQELHFDVQSGAQIAEKIFTYDDNRNLIQESFSNLVDPKDNNQTTYEYDTDNRLTKKKFDHLNSEPIYSYIEEYDYKDGLIQSQTSYYAGNEGSGQKIVYFYTADLVDSIQYVDFSDGNSFRWLSYAYSYDNNRRLVEKKIKGYPGGGWTYTYDSELLAETCEDMNIYGIIRTSCTTNEYNDQGQVIRIYENSEWEYPPVVHRLKEERSYNGNLLAEKRLYIYPGYPQGAVHITRVAYIY